MDTVQKALALRLLEEMMRHACPSNCREDGWNEYWIETHCVGFWVVAKFVDGELVIDSWRTEDC